LKIPVPPSFNAPRSGTENTEYVNKEPENDKVLDELSTLMKLTRVL